MPYNHQQIYIPQAGYVNPQQQQPQRFYQAPPPPAQAQFISQILSQPMPSHQAAYMHQHGGYSHHSLQQQQQLLQQQNQIYYNNK